MGITIIIIYLFIIYRIYRIARQANNLYNSLLSYGISIYFLSHVVINLIGVMGLAPLTGVPLPFLSYGGSYIISLMCALGISERVAVESYNKNNKKKKLKKN